MKRRSILLLGLTVFATTVTTVVVVFTAAAGGGSEPTIPSGEALVSDVNQRISEDPQRSAAIGELTRAEVSVFGVARGDPVDVDLLVSTQSMSCIAVSGANYASSVGCSRMKDIREEGTYQLVVPLTGKAVPLVVGILPAGKSSATARTNQDAAGATIRGRLFLAALPAGALGANNSIPVTVEFGS